MDMGIPRQDSDRRVPSEHSKRTIAHSRYEVADVKPSAAGATRGPKFGGKTMRVCVIERDHKPLMDVRNPGHVLAFADDAKGVAAMKRRLNRYPQNGSSPYYDAVLYERIEPGPKEGVTA